MAETKVYEVEEFRFELTPDGDPYRGVLQVTAPELEPYTAEVNLSKYGSRKNFAREAHEDCGMSKTGLKTALNALCSKIYEEVAAAKKSEQESNSEEDTPEVSEEEIEERVGCPGVLDRFTDDVAKFSNVVGELDMIRLIVLGACSAQLNPLPSGKPLGTNIIITAEAGRGKNHICDAVARLLPQEFCFPFVSASAKSFYYIAADDPTFLKHRWVYPNEAEGTDDLVETLRPMLSGGAAMHITVNKDASGSNVGQELTVEGPITITIPTVRNKLDNQLQTRTLVADLKDYVGRVAAHSEAISEQISPDYAGSDHTPEIRTWQAALRSLTDIRKVATPIHHKSFRFDSDQVSHGARLWTNVLGLMCAHAWLEQRNRQRRTLGGESAIVAAPEDYETAYKVFRATCERSVINLSDTHRKILDAIHKLREEGSELEKKDWFGFPQRKIAERAGIAQSTVSDHKTCLVKSVKMLVETSDGKLNLVDGADPSWWEKGDMLDGFPKPDQVREWWATDSPSTDPTDQGDHRHDDAEEPREYEANSDREVADQDQDVCNHAPSVDDRGDAEADRLASDHQNGLGKRRVHLHDLLMGVIGPADD